MKVLFFGTPQFAADVLSYLLDHGVNIAAVVTRTDKPKGRALETAYPAVKKFLLENHPDIPLFQPEKVSTPESLKQLEPFQADLFVVVAYGEILKESVLSMPKIGCINLHASLLPKYRGAAPIQRSIINGEKETGATIMHMVKKMDAGEMLKSVKIAIAPNETYGELEKQLCTEGSKALLDVIQNFSSYDASRIPQDESQVTFAPKIELEDCEIDWTLPAQKIHDLIRGVDPYPGAWCYVMAKGVRKRLKIKKASVEALQGAVPGVISSCDSKGLVVGAGLGALRILELQLEGKKAMHPMDLLRGSSLKFLVKDAS